MNRALIICGPTASGKTDYAHRIGQKYNGEIINCDSMQIYRQIPIITASPDITFKNEIPYHLYNCINISEDFSVAKYIHLAEKHIRETLKDQKLPIIVGGSGMYINALLYGISAMPDISHDVRQRVRNEAQNNGTEYVYELLKQIDPSVATRLHPRDSQRVMRAYEVILQSHKSISEFQQSATTRLLADIEFKVTMLLPERSFLYDNCNKRLQSIFDNGAIEEIAQLIKDQDMHERLLSIKALGVLQIIDYLEGKTNKEQALEIACTKTRQYAKRQVTWFKNQIPDKDIIQFSNIDEYNACIARIAL